MNRKQYTLNDIRAAAAGHWPDIHAALGVPREYLNTHRHTPCPHCGGRDRYRYTDWQGNGGFICNQCTPAGGSGFDLLMMIHGYEFSTAVNEVAALLGIIQASKGQPRRHTPPPTPTPTAPPIDHLNTITAQWNDANPLQTHTPAARYLQTRGIPLAAIKSARNIRFHAALPLWATRCIDSRTAAPVCIGRYPAMLAAITDTRGALQGLHKTYLQPISGSPNHWQKLTAFHPDTGDPLPAKKMQSRYHGAIKGAAVHIGTPDEHGRLLVCEGIETALAAATMFCLPVAAALSANGMAAFHWPKDCTNLYIAADNDHSQTGIKAAQRLAERAIQAGLSVHIWQPDTPNTDALDELNKRNQNERQATA